jgi:hypothetical protein
VSDDKPPSLLTRIGRRGAALLFFAVLDFVYCYALLEAPRPLVAFYAWMNGIMPLPAWAALWGAVGVVCLLFAFALRDTPAFMAAAGLKVGWGLLAFFGWLAGTIERGYLSAVIWLAFAAFVYLIAGGIPAAPPPTKRWRRVDPLLAVAGPILTLLGVIAAGYFTYRSSNRKLHTDSGQKMIDQMQEDVAEMRREILTLQKQVRIQGDYIGVLRRHIGDGHPPPPPTWPDGLIS